ncbi:protein YgfX [Pseudomonas benzenivorans]|uniref:Protein YgfX n=1 Tax=Pseudomonas benzenivorans TaxID=556533 RepID=A0ABZ0PZI8_9PSED|nr:protein YgfX [Pseudomonas benzenivorans]WPC06274.1 protein YgfX [Pseudomonas benzenivorans]
MSSPSEVFECRWRPSRLLLLCYGLTQALALLSLLWVELPPWGYGLAVALCLGHAAWVLPRHILLSSAQAFGALRHDADGWQLWNRARGWQAIQLRPDSLALPPIVVLRFRLANERRVRGLCIPRDALAHDIHRRLRVRLKFSRRRWAAPE